MHIFSVPLLFLVSVTSGYSWNFDKIKPSTIRQQLVAGISKVSSAGAAAGLFALTKAVNAREQFEYQPALQGLDYGKVRTVYPDFTQVKSGLQYKMVKEGDGKTPAKGDRVVLDWEGYTIGYYGRPFEARNKVQGGAFSAKKGERDDEYFRFIVGSGTAVAAVDEAVQYLKEVIILRI